MRDVGVSCEACIWFNGLEEEEDREFKKQGLEVPLGWCYFDPEEIAIWRIKYCYRLRCASCGGDIEDMENHADCMKIEVELE